MHIPPNEPDAEWENDFLVAWWRDPAYKIGELTKRARRIKIMNMLSRTNDILEVASEETLYEIQDRYRIYNFHTESYTWKRFEVPLDMDKTLEENGVVDEGLEF